jgi:signal transduction histidine kinase
LRSDGGSVRPREAVDPVPVVKAVVAELGRSNIPVELDMTSDELRVRMDAQDFHSVLTHLVTNAIEASCEGDSVKVRVRTQEARIVLDVEDQGPGMDAAFVRNELFTPLRTTKSRGHGIGAFQAREMVRGAGGDIEVISVPGHGTIMRIMVPNAAAAPHGSATLSQQVAGA